ncbi:MAG: dockerin type I repeat-containing protein [Clostridiales bacterium]|jgi:hypothetical protein|nr:dockerin type I repeat-containing protein [Clostridiales bacterium]
MRKVISLILTLLIVVGAVPVFAAEETYEPVGGKYTIVYNDTNIHEGDAFVLFVFEGVRENFPGFSSTDGLIYTAQQTATEGSVTFADFAPSVYSQATAFLSGGNLDIVKLGTLEIIYGDVNSSGGTPNVADLLAVRKYIAEERGDISFQAADVNIDGAIDMRDVFVLRRFIVRWYQTLPIAES